MTSIGISPSMTTPSVPQIDQNAGRERLDQAGKEFEGVFLSMMLKEMRNSLEGGGFFGEEGSDTYGGMFDLFISQHLSEARPLGISEMLLEQYSKMQPSDQPNADQANSEQISQSISITT